MGWGRRPWCAKIRWRALAVTAALRDYIAYDFAIGNLIAKAGYRVVLSSHIIDHVVNQKSFRRMWQNQLRWAQTTRYSRPKGHFGSGLIFAMPYGLLGFVAAGVFRTLGNWSASAGCGCAEPVGGGVAGGLDGGA